MCILFSFKTIFWVQINSFPPEIVAESAGGQHKLVEAMYVRICINWYLQFLWEIVLCLSVAPKCFIKMLMALAEKEIKRFFIYKMSVSNYQFMKGSPVTAVKSEDLF